ncbi:oxidoreductase [Roridomyces roridus]|uniref:Oxidoreductase n=1 Tax=Roridomyces roridus TaxID=1738132 RepID=A0AAD7BV74_9AGAR|nr:oxidoreductase [Roridomyces roridus]
MSKVVLITGCSSGGIGYALCERFAAEGCRVYATARRLEAMTGLDSHPLISLLTLDVTNDDDVRRVMEQVVAQAGGIDIVVNNAGLMGIGPLIEQPLETVHSVFEANTYGTLRVAQAAFPHMAAKRSGLVINIGSIVADIATPWNGLYSASKAAVRAISDTLSMEFKPFGVRVLHVAPGAVKSNIANNQEKLFSLPSTSMYRQFLPNMIQRMHSSQGPNSIPADKFAKVVVKAALKKNPPGYLTLGGNAFIFKVFGYLPKAWVLWYLWRLYSRKAAA